MLAFLDTIIGFAVIMLGISLLITILNQIVSALVAHRGSNLRWGLEVLFQQLNPTAGGYPLLAARARTLAETILTHPLISDSIFSTKWERRVAKFPRMLAMVRRWQLATGIRPEELSAVLNQIIHVRPPQMPKHDHAALRRELSQLLNTPSSSAMRDASLSSQVAAQLNPGTLADKVVSDSPTAMGHLEDLLGKVIERVRQRFTMWMRVWTVIFAVAFAGFGCLDSLTIIKTIYSNSSLRAQLVNAAPQTTAAALNLSPDPSQMFADALKTAVPTPPAGAPPIPAPVASPSDAKSWIEKALTDPTAQRQAEDRFDQAVQAALTKRAESAHQILSVLTLPELPMGPHQWKFRPPDLGQILGVVITAFLLSLGAPFWFNTLNTLTSLRPLLAGPPAQAQAQSKS